MAPKTPKNLTNAVQPPPSTVTRRQLLPKTPLRQTLMGSDGEEEDCFGRTPIQPIKKTPGPLITATPVVGEGSKKSSNIFQTIQVHQDDSDEHPALENLENAKPDAENVENVKPDADVVENARPNGEIVEQKNEDAPVETLFDQLVKQPKRTPIYERLYRQRPAHQQEIPAKRGAASQVKVLQQRLQTMRNARTRDSFSIKPLEQQVKPRQLTIPKPFSFVNRPAPRKPTTLAAPPAPTFKARPAPHPAPFRPAASHRPVTQPRPIQLALDRRLEARHRWEESQRQREAQLAPQKQQAMEARKKQEAMEIRHLRQSQVHRPLPMPRFGPVEMVKRSERPLTVPHSPKLATNRRIRLAK